MRRKLKLLKAGEPMPLTKRIYPLETLRAAVMRADLDKLFVFLRVPDMPSISEMCGAVKRLYLDGDVLVAEVDFLRNANGLIGDMMAGKGVQFSICGVGTIEGLVVQPDYYITYLVPLPDQVQPMLVKSIFRRKARQSRGVKSVQGEAA